MAENKGLNVLITGAGRGIGKGVAMALGEAGYNVGVHYNSSAEGALEAVEYIKQCGGKAKAYQADLGQISEINRLFDEYLADFGHVDIMINNSGITKYADILDATPELFDLLTNVDWRATFFCTQLAAKDMIKNGVHGSIICTSSVQDEVQNNGASVYASNKCAVTKFVKHAALELADYKIRVNCISPGHIKVLPDDVILPREKEQVARIPWHRVGRPRDIANMILFLIDNDKADYITGAEFCVNGGLPLPSMLDNFRNPLPPVGVAVWPPEE